MNFIDMQRQVYWLMGRPYEADIEDHERQACKDGLNFAYREIISALSPYYWRHVRQSSFATVAGTTVYTLDDDVVSPIQFWTADDRARPIPFKTAINADQLGYRNSNASSSYTGILTWYPKTTTASKSGTDGSVTAGSTAFTKTGGTAFTAADDGKMLRLNGEEDFVMTYVSANAATLDRAYTGRLTGTGVANSPSSLTTVPWQVSPAGRYRVELLPTTSVAETISYRYHYLPPPLSATTDVPDFPDQYHMALVWCACANNLASREKDPAYYFGKYQGALKLLQNDNLQGKHQDHVTQYEVSHMGAAQYPFSPVDLDGGR